MLTIFTIPKPFRNHIAIIQRNAIQSWLKFCPPCEILLVGDDYGTAEVASEYGIEHIPEVRRNEFGTPLVNSIFEIAEQKATHDLLCYVNADVILMSDFVKAVQHVAQLKQFLMVGRRWNVELRESLDLSQPDWEGKLRLQVTNNGILDSHYALDYFVFPRGLWGTLPPFAVGRPYYDNWLVYSARACGSIVIDATSEVMATHQKHDYSHLPIKTRGAQLYGPEAIQNLKLVGGYRNRFSLWEATHILTTFGLRSCKFTHYVYRIFFSWPKRYPRMLLPLKVLKPLRRVSRKKGLL